MRGWSGLSRLSGLTGCVAVGSVHLEPCRGAARPSEPSLRAFRSCRASRWMDEIGLVFRQVERLQQIRRLEQLPGLMCRSHFRLLMRLPDCCTLGSKILNSDARARTLR